MRGVGTVTATYTIRRRGDGRTEAISPTWPNLVGVGWGASDALNNLTAQISASVTYGRLR